MAGVLFVSGVRIQADDAERFFESRIRPVLIEKCFKCHGSEQVSSNLRIDSRSALTKGGDSGAAIVPGKPDESLLIEAISRTNDALQMPPDDPLPASVVEDFRIWITQGAAWPKTPGSGPDAAFVARKHWAFQAISRPSAPEVRDSGWVRNSIDRFVLAQLEAAGLEPSVRADRATLIRRLKLDLLGLPPTFEETQAFAQDSRVDAWERLVEGYLSSPHYGERWGRHWLDVARYADTKGYVFTADRSYPFAYTYRDWVIESLNGDLPYDDFLIRQIAADWLVEDGLPKSELAAMGFLTLGRRFLNNKHDIIDDRIDVLTRGTMALTVTCARCHDHKYDPIPQADYYSLYGVFASSHEPKEPHGAMALVENDKPSNPHIFPRGRPGNGPRVPRQFLEVVAGPDRKPFERKSGRLELAQAIATPDNPLTARVIVNRIWRHHFHAPLVRTTSDFGLRCEPPSHPELLDWLATHLVDSDWSLKAVHRSILLSAAWQQSSRDSPPKRSMDSENRLLWRMNRGRLELEPMRDAILASAGDFDLTVGGKSIDITTTPTPRRRSVYGFIDRQNLPAFFRTFDFAVPDTHSPGRFRTSVPQQTLYLRNSPYLVNESRRIAAALPEETVSSKIRSLFRRVLSRDPADDEMAMATRFVQAPVDSGLTSSAWSYGFGRFDSKVDRLESFTHLPRFEKEAWQGGGKLPDPRLGWVNLRDKSGHPGDPDHAAIRRWTAPEAVTVRVRGDLRHPSEHGNGVDGIIVRQSTHTLGRWTAQKGNVRTNVKAIPIAAGETIDFIVDCRGDVAFDSFEWTIEIVDAGNPAKSWNSVSQFHGPLPAPLDAWGMLAQVLLLSNEFQFVD